MTGGESHNSLSNLKPHLTNYYFNEAIAEEEIKAWAKLISKTVSDRLIDSNYYKVKLIEDNQYFRTIIGCRDLYFKSGYQTTLIFFEAESKDDLFVIDNNDMFPRYYFDCDRSIAEHNSWVKIRKKEISRSK